jgi:predicted metalloprotease
MRWRTGRRSRNVEDRRGRRLGGGLKLGGGATLIIILLALFLGQDPLQLLESTGQLSLPPTDQRTPATDEQADCFAGVWAYHADRQRQILEAGDIEEGLAAAAAIGDDRLMKMSGRAISPESFTHGTSEQRARWLRQGLTTGNLQACDTFSDLNLR